jgi:hypothetical protein
MRIEEFSDIKIHPYVRLEEFGKTFCGGAEWPEGTDDFVRHKRGEDFYDTPPTPTDASRPTVILEGEYLYGGILVGHFGHQVAEFCHRLWPLHDKPMRVIFVASDGYVHVPGFLKDLVLFLGATEIVVVDKLTRVEKLVVAASGKFLNQPAPPWYIEKLNAFWRKVPLQKKNFPKKLAVMRGHLQTGRIVGEQYLSEQLKKSGYFLFRPEDFSLLDQIDFYRAAEVVIFSEGSAIHALDIAPSLKAKVMVIFRRGGSRIGSDTLKPRCANYHEYNKVFDISSLSKKGGNDISTISLSACLEAAKEKIDRNIVLSAAPHQQDIQRDIRSYALFHRGGEPEFEAALYEKFKQHNVVDEEPRKARRSSAAEILRALRDVNAAQRYLEIGVNRGKTFNDVDVPYKHGVGTNFRFDTTKSQRPGIKLINTTSDDYFSKLHREAQFDLVYIDGFHTVEQTLRELTSSLTHAHSRTIWLLSSVIPLDFLGSIPDPDASIKARRAHGNHVDREWHGDVYRLVFLIEAFFPSLSYATVYSEKENTYHSVLWQAPRAPEKIPDTTLNRVADTDYMTQLTNRKVFNIWELDSIAFRISESFYSQNNASDITFD